MKWDYECEGKWSASSCVGDDGLPFSYVIRIQEDGLFSLAETDDEIRLESFQDRAYSLDMAKTICETNEHFVALANGSHCMPTQWGAQS